MTYPLALIFIYPFTLFKKRNKGSLFFFFDRYVIGGAQRVHLDIMQCIEDKYKQVYFTRSSFNDVLKNGFYSQPNSKCSDIHLWCDNLIFRIFTVHYFAFYINRHQKAHVFSSNSTFFYDMLPFMRKSVIKTELLHNFTYGKKGMEFFGLANYKYLNHRICVDYSTAINIKEQYKEHTIPKEFNERVMVIEPGVSIPELYNKHIALPLRVIYAGRGSAQKRVYLIEKIMEKCLAEKLPVEFHFAGSVVYELAEKTKQSAVIHGEIKDKAEMDKLYLGSHILIMTSAYEGFPMVIKEAMAYGCIPLVTALEGNKTHLVHLKNSLLIDNFQNEDYVVQEGTEYIKMLCRDLQLTDLLSQKAYKYAKENFSINIFFKKYSDFFNG
ncbi:MAG TPA: glycosyltransferase family 4 protein [Flavipsychrobacter sp.]|nr:glycosyltransferase family 4 protein [Flavipsychrobacter sp.]